MAAALKLALIVLLFVGDLFAQKMMSVLSLKGNLFSVKTAETEAEFVRSSGISLTIFVLLYLFVFRFVESFQYLDSFVARLALLGGFYFLGAYLSIQRIDMFSQPRFLLAVFRLLGVCVTIASVFLFLMALTMFGGRHWLWGLTEEILNLKKR